MLTVACCTACTLPCVLTLCGLRVGWVYMGGCVRSDPLKNAQLREASRQRLACLNNGKCTKASKALTAFTRLLVKVPEHTWGVSQIWFLPDYVNYTNSQFDKARAQQALGFVADNRRHADCWVASLRSSVPPALYRALAPNLLARPLSLSCPPRRGISTRRSPGTRITDLLAVDHSTASSIFKHSLRIPARLLRAPFGSVVRASLRSRSLPRRQHYGQLVD